MRIAIRADASVEMGTGHLRRCMSLLQALIELDAQVCLVTRAHDSVASQLLRDVPCPVHWLHTPLAERAIAADAAAPPHADWAGVPGSQDAQETIRALIEWHPDWVVVDHYAFDARWHDAVRAALDCRLLVIDDTADRLLAPDVLLDHNWAPDHRAKYAGRLTREPHWLAGPRYALLSSAYRKAPKYSFHETVRSIGIFMGGTDPDGISVRALAACRVAGFSGPVEVASTSSNPHLAALRQACTADGHATLTLDAPDLAAFFARHDLQIGAGGGATWERCCIGAPTLTVMVAKNQIFSVPLLASLGVIHMAGNPMRWSFPSSTVIATHLNTLFLNPQSRKDLSDRSRQLVDGKGAHRIAKTLLEFKGN